MITKNDFKAHNYDVIDPSFKPIESVFAKDGVTIYHADVLTLYETWESPITIVSDGPYGVSGFLGDPPTAEELPEWYISHIRAWSERASPQTTLWFWNTEIGWANVHPILVKYGWRYVNCHIWDKGICHIAGNANTKTLRKFPVVTEVCVQYVRDPKFEVKGQYLTMRDWLRYEWGRTGLPFSKTNDACNVRNAASRKYFTKDHLWYYPPVEAFEGLVNYANKHGNPQGAPYFSIDGKKSLTGEEWKQMRAKFHCELGVTNVWREPPLNGEERLKIRGKSVHLKIIELIIRSSSDKGDLIWEPFGGLCTTAIAAYKLSRRCVSAEMQRKIFELAVSRLKRANRCSITGTQGTLERLETL
jgi:hypothetical protein